MNVDHHKAQNCLGFLGEAKKIITYHSFMASIICFGASYIQKLKDFWAEESDFCDFLYKLRGGFPSTVHLLTLSMHTKHTSKISNDDVLLFRRRRCEVFWAKRWLEGTPQDVTAAWMNIFWRVRYGAFLVGGWTNPFEKHAPQIGSNLPQVGMKIKKSPSLPLSLPPSRGRDHHLIFVASDKKHHGMYGVTQKSIEFGAPNLSDLNSTCSFSDCSVGFHDP